MARLRLRDLRDLAVAVLHPRDADGSLMLDQLKRIGCRTEAHWPPPGALGSEVDVVFAAISRDHHADLMRMLRKGGAPSPAVIAVVDYENPAMLQLVLEIEALAVVSKPVRPFGILTNLVVAREAWMHMQELNGKVRKLENRLVGQKKIAKAKSILMENQGITEQVAYRTIRAQAMAKRVPIEEMAVAIINANELLSSRIE
jgi:AmiR/NasT family two-component response regulator